MDHVDHKRETSHYDTLWENLTQDELEWTPQNLASAPDILPLDHIPEGEDGFVLWTKQNMMVAMQQLARRRATLLEQRKVARQRVAEFDAILHSLHKEAKGVYREYQRQIEIHRLQRSFYP